MLLQSRKNLFLALLISICFVMVSCGNNGGGASKSTNESITPTADEDGNIDIEVNMKNSEFHGAMNKKWRKDELSNKEKRVVAKVKDILDATNIQEDSSSFECVYEDTKSNISIWSLVGGKNDENLDYYGIIICNNDKTYTFPEVCHGKNPIADYNEKTKKIYLACDVIEGTGTHAEALYVFNVNGDKVEYEALFDPYDVQEHFIEKMSYDVKQNDITIKVNNRVVSKIVNTEDGNGALRALVLGEQIAYEFDEKHNIKVTVIPGIKFGPGTSIYYDESPSFIADVKYNKNNFKIDNIKVVEE